MKNCGSSSFILHRSSFPINHPMNATAPSRMSLLRKAVLRFLGFALLLYLGVLLMLMFFENRLVFQPTRASEDWQTAPSSYFQDVELVSAKGTKLHAWWCPLDGSDQAMLYLHGNAGNLSHRGPSVQKVRDIAQDQRADRGLSRLRQKRRLAQRNWAVTMPPRMLPTTGSSSSRRSNRSASPVRPVAGRRRGREPGQPQEA